MTRTYLKIKIKSLAAEAVIIKQEERKWKQLSVCQDNVYQPHPMFFALRNHRLMEVRTECRSAIIAYGYLRGRSYRQIEAKCYEQPDWHRVTELVLKYGKGNWQTAEPKNQKQLLHTMLHAWRDERLEQQAAE